MMRKKKEAAERKAGEKKPEVKLRRQKAEKTVAVDKTEDGGWQSSV